MPGIVGIVSDEGIEQHQQDLQRMINPLLRAPGLCASRAVGERFALGDITVPAAGEGLAYKNGNWLAYFGLIVEGHGFTPPPEPGQESTDCGPQNAAQALLDRYLTFGLAGVCGLNGYYALAIWEEAERRLTLVKDRHGYLGLYYWHSPRRLMFASEYKSISCHPQFEKKVNPTAVADLVIQRLVVGERTLFQNINNLPPAGVLIYQDGQIHLHTYWQPPFYNQTGRIRRDEDYADELAGFMSEAVRRRVRPNNCLMITGGLDSRVVSGAYHKVAPNIELVTSTIGVPTCTDALVGKEVAKALGYPHYHIPLADDYLVHYGAQSTWLFEGKLCAHASWILGQTPFLSEHKLNYAMSGLYGNFISGRHYPPALYKAQNLEQGAAAAATVLDPYFGHLQEIMRPEIFKTAGHESASYIRDVFINANPTDQFQKFDWTVLYWRIGYVGNTATVISDVGLALEPILDNDVIDYTIGSIPPEVRARAKFYHHLIIRHLPIVAGVKYGRSGFSVKTDLMIQENSALAWLFDKQRRALKRLFPRRSEVRACIPQAGAIRGQSRSYVEQYLSRSDILADYFDMQALRTMLDDHVSGKRNAFMALDAVLTFALWYEQFCNLGGPLPEARYDPPLM